VTNFYITAFGRVDASAMNVAANAIENAFGFEPRPLEPLAVPPGAFDAARNQFSSVAMLKELAARAPLDAFRVLALTEKDLFIPMLTFLFGQAQLGGRVALVSLARLRQEFYGMTPNASILAVRTATEALHEVGHTFSLLHCTNAICAMALSTGVRALDAKRAAFCPACGILLKENLAQFEMEKTA
jgi:archaemetzincin